MTRTLWCRGAKRSTPTAFLLASLGLVSCGPATVPVDTRFELHTPESVQAPVYRPRLRFFVSDITMIDANGAAVPVRLDPSRPWQDDRDRIDLAARRQAASRRRNSLDPRVCCAGRVRQHGIPAWHPVRSQPRQSAACATTAQRVGHVLVLAIRAQVRPARSGHFLVLPPRQLGLSLRERSTATNARLSPPPPGPHTPASEGGRGW